MMMVIPVLSAVLLHFIIRWPRRKSLSVVTAILVAVGIGMFTFAAAKSIILEQRDQSLNAYYYSAIDDLGEGTSLVISTPPQDTGLPEDQLVLLVQHPDHRFLFPFPRRGASLDRQNSVSLALGIASALLCLPMSAFAIHRCRRKGAAPSSS
jgi:hypothetical protein